MIPQLIVKLWHKNLTVIGFEMKIKRPDDYTIIEMKNMSLPEFLDKIIGNQQKLRLCLVKLDFDPSTGRSRCSLFRKDMVGTDLQLGNGCQWLRQSNILFRICCVNFVKDARGVCEINIGGYRPKKNISQNNRQIPNSVKAYYRKEPQICCVCGIKCRGCKKKPEIDHRNGRYDDQKFDQNNPYEYQLLCNNHNTWKRECCNKCRKTGKRFDARIFPGEILGWHYGVEKYEGTCKGCFLSGIKDWRKEAGDVNFDRAAQYKIIDQSEPAVEKLRRLPVEVNLNQFFQPEVIAKSEPGGGEQEEPAGEQIFETINSVIEFFGRPV